MGSIAHSMFHMQLPLLEKIARPMIVYVVLIAFLRVFGKRELAQLNPFDLVVLLSLSNTVQNAMIGDDNSVSGGLVGAFSLLAVNWMLSKATYRAPRINEALQGSERVLILNGKMDEHALQKETLTHEEMIQVLNRNGYSDPAEVQVCTLQPNGTFYVKGKQPSSEGAELTELLNLVKRLSDEVSALRAGTQPQSAD